MESDDGTVARVPLYIIKNIVGRHPFGVVSGDEIPHHNLVFSTQPGVLCQTHPTMGRTNVVAVDIGIGFLHVVTVFLDGVGEADNMVMGVIAHLVTLCDDALADRKSVV